MSRGNKWNMRKRGGNRISSLWKPKHHLHLCLHDKDWVAHALVLVHYMIDSVLYWTGHEILSWSSMFHTGATQQKKYFNFH